MFETKVNQMKKISILFILLSVILLNACYTEEGKDYEGKVMGYKPIYSSYETIRKVSLTDARPIRQSGKIYVKDGYLYVVEPNAGIHVINNFDQKNPKAERFINIPGNIDMAIKGHIIYADNGLDLVAIDISDPKSIKILKRIEGVLPYPKYPPYENVKFECPDSTKGYVVSWEFVELENPKCYR